MSRARPLVDDEGLGLGEVYVGGVNPAGAPGDEPDEVPLFEGVTEIIELIRNLRRRPTGRGRPDMPMVCLVRPDDGNRGLLPYLATRCEPDGERGRIPHALIDAEKVKVGSSRQPEPQADREQVLKVRDLLNEVADELVKSKNGASGRLRFPRLDVLTWLMDQSLRNSRGRDPQAQLRRLLLSRASRSSIINWARRAVQTVPERPSVAWIVIATALVGLPFIWLRLRFSGRVPLVSGPYRWFMRQSQLPPRSPADFVGFAEQLTKEEWPRESSQQVTKLLVNAFLADLRHVYRRSYRRPLGRRRMTYPVLLLDNITRDNGGYDLQRAVNDVRNEVRLNDPLLLVSGSRKVPPHALELPAGAQQTETVVTATRAATGLAAWRGKVDNDRRKRRDTAWYLIITIPRPASPEEQDEFEIGVLALGKEPLDQPPWWGRQVTKVTGLVVVLAGVAVAYIDWSQAHCGTWWPGLEPELTTIGNECVGVSDGSYDFFQSSDRSLNLVTDTIVRQNEQSSALHDANPQRPYVTIVFFSDLTPSTGPAAGRAAEREELQGIAVAQRRQLDKGNDFDPVVRILIANGGVGMRHGEFVAQQLGALAKTEDPPIVGVVGLAESRVPTEKTIRALANVGLPVVAATLSADRLANNSMYYQVAPQNRRQAKVIASYAAYLRDFKVAGLGGGTLTSSVRIFYSSDQDDTYSANLHDDLKLEFEARGFAVESFPFTPSGLNLRVLTLDGSDVGPASAAGRQNCDDYQGLVLYAARGIPDFAGFLAGVEQCPTLPWIIGGDDVTRYVADPNLRRSQRAVPFSYMSFAVAPRASGEQEDNFYASLTQMFPFESSNEGRSLDGHAALAFDATQSLITAVQYLREGAERIPITPTAVWHELSDIHTAAGDVSNTKALQGATGVIDFGGDVRRHVPINKPVAILQVQGGRVDTSNIEYCGELGTVESQLESAWCPPSERDGG